MDVSSPDEMYIEFREYENIDEDAPKVTKLKRPTEKFSQIVRLIKTFVGLAALTKSWL